MRSFLRPSAAAAFCAATCIAWCQAQAPAMPAATLHVGDQAPSLSPAKILKGTLLTKYGPDQTTLVVFWSTWCGAFVPVIQHLDELEGQFNRQMQVVAVSVFESNQSSVVGYVDKMGSKMDFTVAVDNGSDQKHGLDGQLAATWLQASGQMSLPIAFIIDKTGKIAWIGSPAGSLIDEPLRKIIDGSWDIEAFKQRFDSAQEKQKQETDLGAQIQLSMENKKWDDALRFADELIPLDQETAASARYLILLQEKDWAGAYSYCKQMADGPFAKDARGLYDLGWLTINPKAHYDKANYPLGLEVMKKAVELTYQKNAEMLDGLAWAYYQSGDKANAATTEQRAINAARPDQVFQLTQNLKTFQRP